MCSVYDDVELLDRLRWAEENGTTLLRKLAEAAMTAAMPHYLLLRPVLIARRRNVRDQSEQHLPLVLAIRFGQFGNVAVHLGISVWIAVFPRNQTNLKGLIWTAQ